MRDKDAPSGRLSKASPAKAEGGRGSQEEDRSAKEKQMDASPKRQEVADSATPAIPKGPESLPAAPPRPLVSGFREGAAAGGVGSNLGPTPPAAG